MGKARRHCNWLIRTTGPGVELNISHRCVFLGEAQSFPGFYQTRKTLPTQTSIQKLDRRSKTSEGDWSQRLLTRFLERPFGLVVLKLSLVPKDQTSVPLCLGMSGTGSALCGLVSLLILFFLSGSLITKYHNNGKKLPRGHLGRNCIISDHFREEVGGGWEGRPEFTGKDALSVHGSVILNFLHSLSSDFFHLLNYPLVSFLYLPFSFHGAPSFQHKFLPMETKLKPHLWDLD